jgi:hypothetical protein
MYKIRRDETGVRFACSRCTYSVLVHKKKGGIGSPRTFAAAILIRHAKEEHDRPSRSDRDCNNMSETRLLQTQTLLSELRRHDMRILNCSILDTRNLKLIL